jgi:hypothetical protein
MHSRVCTLYAACAAEGWRETAAERHVRARGCGFSRFFGRDQMFYVKKKITREVYDFCLHEGYADANLIAKVAFAAGRLYRTHPPSVARLCTVEEAGLRAPLLSAVYPGS